MKFTGLLIAFLAALIRAERPEEKISFDASLQDDKEAVVPPLIYLGSLDTRGRGDIGVAENQPTKTEFQGYFYSKPLKPFTLPTFKTLDPSTSIAKEAQEHFRTRRSPYRRPHYPSPPPFIPGFIPPHHIRPHPPLHPYPYPYPFPHGRPHHT